MNGATNLPGDWTTRGSVIVAESEFCYPLATSTRTEILRDIAHSIKAGQTIVHIANESPTGRVDAQWLRIVAVHLGHDRATRRAVACNVIASI